MPRRGAAPEPQPPSEPPRLNPVFAMFTRPISELQPHPRNARRRTKRNLEALRESLSRYGQQYPVLVNERNQVVKGNGTLQAALELGWTELLAAPTSLERDIVQTAYGIMDNKSALHSDWDYEILQVQFAELREDGIEPVGFGFTDGEAESIQMADWSPPERKPLPEGEKPKGRTITLNDEQWALFNETVRQMREAHGAALSEANCVELLCTLWTEQAAASSPN